jgi:anti-anti-sigma factor
VAFGITGRGTPRATGAGHGRVRFRTSWRAGTRSRRRVDCGILTDLDPALQTPEPFRCEIGRNGTAGWARPVGELDLDTVHQVEQQLAGLRADGCERLVLDLRGLRFMDSTGLRLVIRWDTAAREAGFAFAIVPGVDVVHRVFQLTGMDQHLTVTEPPPGA